VIHFGGVVRRSASGSLGSLRFSRFFSPAAWRPSYVGPDTITVVGKEGCRKVTSARHLLRSRRPLMSSRGGNQPMVVENRANRGRSPSCRRGSFCPIVLATTSLPASTGMTQSTPPSYLAFDWPRHSKEWL